MFKKNNVIVKFILHLVLKEHALESVFCYTGHRSQKEEGRAQNRNSR